MTFASPFTGTFAFEGTIPSSVMNALNTNTPHALDKTGDNSTTTPPGGISGEIELLSGAFFLFDSGAGAIFNSGSNVTWESGSTIFSSGTMQFSSGGLLKIVSGANLTVFSGGNLNLNTGSNVNANSGSFVNFENGSNLLALNGSTITLNSGSLLNLGLGSLNTILSFNSTVTGGISGMEQLATANPGEAMIITAQQSTGSTGGNLYLTGGAGLSGGGAINIVGGTSATGTGGNIALTGGSSTVKGNINVQQGLLFNAWDTSQNSGGTQPQVIQNDMVVITSTGSGSKPSFTIGSLTFGKSAVVTVNYAVRDFTTAQKSGGGTAKIAFWNIGSGAVSGVVTTSSITTNNGTGNAADINSTVSGNSFSIFVNGDSYSNTCYWTLNIQTIYN